MAMTKIGLITIGQSPRTDVTSTIKTMLGQSIDMVEKGALDGLTKNEIERLAPKAGDYVLVTRLRDGASVKVARRRVTPRVQKCIEELEGMDVDFNVLLCTGEFHRLRAKKPLIMPSPNHQRCAVHQRRKNRRGCSRKGADSQRKKEMGKKGVSVVIGCANPYGDVKGLEEAALFLAGENVDIVVLDCIGFTPKAGEIFRRLTRKPVLLPQVLLGCVLKSLVGP
jgi:protein AroM